MALTYTTVQSVKNLVAVGTNFSTGTEPVGTTEALTTFGGANNLGGTTWTPSDISSANFGVIFRFSMASGSSSYLRATNFGFSIPSTDIILGIEFKISAKGSGAGTNFAMISVNYVTCTITTSTGTISNQSNFFLFLGT